MTHRLFIDSATYTLDMSPCSPLFSVCVSCMGTSTCIAELFISAVRIPTNPSKNRCWTVTGIRSRNSGLWLILLKPRTWYGFWGARHVAFWRDRTTSKETFSTDSERRIRSSLYCGCIKSDHSMYFCYTTPPQKKTTMKQTKISPKHSGYHREPIWDVPLTNCIISSVWQWSWACQFGYWSCLCFVPAAVSQHLSELSSEAVGWV